MCSVLVVGCFRSGTSAVAGVLHHLGVFMGSHFNDPNSGNVKGYFEDLDFVKLHYELMFSRDSKEPLLKEYQQLVNQRNCDHAVWGVKDPRLCVLLSDLFHYFPNPKIILTHRDPKAISVSIAKQIGYSEPKTYLPLIDHYLTCRAKFLEQFQVNALSVDYDEIKCVNFAQKIADFVDLPLNSEAIGHISSSGNGE